MQFPLAGSTCIGEEDAFSYYISIDMTVKDKGKTFESKDRMSTKRAVHYASRRCQCILQLEEKAITRVHIGSNI